MEQRKDRQNMTSEAYGMHEGIGHFSDVQVNFGQVNF